MKNNLMISGTRKDIENILCRLITKYGKDARLIDVIEQEQKKYGIKECIILR